MKKEISHKMVRLSTGVVVGVEGLGVEIEVLRGVEVEMKVVEVMRLWVWQWFEVRVKEFLGLWGLERGCLAGGIGLGNWG